MASDGAGTDAIAAGGADDVRADVGALPDIARREAGGWLVPAAAAEREIDLEQPDDRRRTVLERAIRDLLRKFPPKR